MSNDIKARELGNVRTYPASADTRDPALPGLSVILIPAKDDTLNERTFACVERQSAARPSRVIVYLTSGVSYGGWLEKLTEGYDCVTVETGPEVPRAAMYNHAAAYVRESGYVTVVEGGDVFGPSFFAGMLANMSGPAPDGQIEDCALGVPMKRYGKNGTVQVVEDVPARQRVDLATSTRRLPYYMAGTFVSAGYFRAHRFREDLTYEYEADFLLRLAAEEMKMCLVKYTPYIYENVRQNDIRMFPGYYDRAWYYDELENFWIPFLEELKETRGEIPRVIQYQAYQALCCWAEANLDNRNKHCVPEEEAYEYLCGWERLLRYIDDEVIMNVAKQSYAPKVAWHKRMFLRLKYQDEALQFDWYIFRKKPHYGWKNYVEAAMRDQSVDIQCLEVRDGVLHIDATLSGLYDLERGAFTVEKNNVECPVVFNERYAHTKLFGVCVYKRLSFELDIPLEDVNQQRVRFVYTGPFGRMTIPLTFGNHASKLSKRFKNSYWCFVSGGIRYVAIYNQGTILLYKAGRLTVIRKELKLWGNMLFAGKSRKKALAFLLLRMAYFLCRPFLKKRPIWLFLDKIYKGGDSGEYIYRYAAKRDDGIDTYYLIDKKAPEYKKLAADGFKPLVRGSLKHRLIFLYSDLVIASNSTVCEFNDLSLDSSSYVRDLLNFHVACVQHGMSVQKIAIAQNRLRDNTRLYFCASKYEIENLSRPVYDYAGRDILKLTGVPRYDGLIDEDKRQIVITPTWRMQAALAPKGNEGVMRDYNPLFKDTDYFKIYNALINDPRLITAAKEYGYRLLYVLHPIVSPQLEDFDKNDYVDIVPATGDMSYETVFRQSSLMVTDSSGVQFDFAYMRKPVVYLHHEDMPQHYEEGTFHYDTMAFGEICRNNDELIDTLIEYMKNDCRMKPEYAARADDFFAFDDHHNCARIYDELLRYTRERATREETAGGLGRTIRRHAVEGTLLGKVLRPVEKLPGGLGAKAKGAVKAADARLAGRARARYAARTEIQDNKLFFMTYDSSFICNQKYIVEEILRRKLPVEIVWGVPRYGTVDRSLYPPEVKLVRRATEEMVREVASARIWIENALEFPLYRVPKKKGQIYMNTWHGSLGIKRLSGDDVWMKRAAKVGAYTDYCVTNSKFEEDVFRSTFWPETPFLKFGHARNDLFFHPEVMAEKRRHVLEHYGIPADKRLFLYAPTFREAGMAGYEAVDFTALRQALERRFGGPWVILVRWHHKERKLMAHTLKGKDVIDASDFGDMQELLPAIDAGMSDYSSWVYDFILARKPIFLYAPDIADYDQARGFYYPLDTTPFPIAGTNGELAAAVESFDEEAYLRRVDEFLTDKGCYEDGHAAQRIVDTIEKLLAGETVAGER